MGWFIYSLTTVTLFTYNPGTVNFSGILATFFAELFIGAIFSHNKQLLEKQKLQLIESIGASIAHELRTPMRSIGSSASGIKKYLPDLIKAYQLAKASNIQIPYIPQPHYNSLLSALDNIEWEVESSFNFIKMLLINVNPHKVISEKEEVCSIKNCIETALNRYPFDLGEKELVHWEDKKDFLFKGNAELIIHVLFNLLKNALYYVRAAGHGEIWIKLELGDKENKLLFTDTGTGIPPNILRQIFNRFFSRTPHGTGVGLAFCRLVMQRFKGDITCHSQENEYTEFVLSFPVEADLRLPTITAPT